MVTASARGDALRVLIDPEAFIRHRRSGITRYFTELLAELEDPSLGVRALAPYHFVANIHLHERYPDRFRALPLPGGMRASVLNRLNERRRRTVGVVDVAHHTLYLEDALVRWPARKHVASVYDFTFELFPDRFPGHEVEVAQKRSFLEVADAVVCISEATAHDLVRVYPDLDKPVYVTPLAAGREFGTPAQLRPRNVPERYLLHVGNRHAHKNVDILFRAFAHLAEEDPGLSLVLCGNHLPDEPARLRELGVADRVRALRVSDAELPWLYQHAEAFVFPSLYEGFGLPVVEAMAAGCPALIADVPALREVADDAALTFEPHDLDALVEGLLRVLNDPQAANRMREQGRNRALEFSWRRTAAGTAQAYREIASA